LLISIKLDGCRLLIKQGKIVTRSLKSLVNKQLNEKFEPLRKYTEEKNIIIDGEVFAPNIPFQFIVSCFMTENYNTKQAIKKWDEMCKEHNFFSTREEVFNKLKFYCFDYLHPESPDIPFKDRIIKASLVSEQFPKLMELLEHKEVHYKKEIEDYFQKALEEGYEGLILRNPNGRYKFNRCTIKENIAFKLKPWVTEDAKIIDIVQATQVNKDIEKTITELGRSRTSKRQEDRHNINKAQGFVVDFHGKELIVPIAMTDKMKKYIWLHQNEYVNKFIEFKYMNVGMKDLPRIPKFIRIREDKE